MIVQASIYNCLWDISQMIIVQPLQIKHIQKQKLSLQPHFKLAQTLSSLLLLRASNVGLFSS